MTDVKKGVAIKENLGKRIRLLIWVVEFGMIDCSFALAIVPLIYARKMILELEKLT